MFALAPRERAPWSPPAPPTGGRAGAASAPAPPAASSAPSHDLGLCPARSAFDGAVSPGRTQHRLISAFSDALRLGATWRPCANTGGGRCVSIWRRHPPRTGGLARGDGSRHGRRKIEEYIHECEQIHPPRGRQLGGDGARGDVVASIIEGQPGVRLFLLHVFAPLPPKLLEFGGAENPAEEERREAAQRDARTQWIARAKACADDLFAKAQSILRTAGVPAQAVETQLATPLNGEAVVTNILEAARANQCGTVVVGRQSFSWLQELFQHHIGEELIRRGQGLAIWVVE